MNYLYYPGCSLKSTGRAYEESLLALFRVLGSPLDELDDWNCCGATAYMSISELKAFSLSARNLALAERKQQVTGDTDLVVPCAACYLGLNKTRRYLSEHPDVHRKVNDALGAAGMRYSGNVRVRHPLDVLINDIGLEIITEKLVRPLTGLRVACYYGCQIVRPYAEFDEQHRPTTMDRLLKALGAELVEWPLKTRCCGGSLSGTVQDVGLRLSYILLKEASKRGADVIATACPLCQFNLECYQSNMSRLYESDVQIPVAYFTQLMGMALGIAEKKLGLQRLFVPMPHTHEEAAVSGGDYVRT